MTPHQTQTAHRLLRTVNGGTDIGEWARTITSREWARTITSRDRAGLPVNKNDLATAKELLQIADKLRKK